MEVQRRHKHKTMHPNSKLEWHWWQCCRKQQAGNAPKQQVGMTQMNWGSVNSQTQEDDTCILEIAQFTTESVKVHLDYAFSSEGEKREDSMGERYKNICNNNMAGLHWLDLTDLAWLVWLGLTYATTTWLDWHGSNMTWLDWLGLTWLTCMVTIVIAVLYNCNKQRGTFCTEDQILRRVKRRALLTRRAGVEHAMI